VSHPTKKFCRGTNRSETDPTSRAAAVFVLAARVTSGQLETKVSRGAATLGGDTVSSGQRLSLFSLSLRRLQPAIPGPAPSPPSNCLALDEPSVWINHRLVVLLTTDNRQLTTSLNAIAGNDRPHFPKLEQKSKVVQLLSPFSVYILRVNTEKHNNKP
jgi:hypothetical protein